MKDNRTEKGEKELLEHNYWKAFLIEAFLFAITLLAGIMNAWKINQTVRFQQQSIPTISIWYFIFSFSVSTLFIFLLVRLIRTKERKRTIFTILFLFSIFLGGTLFLDSWMPWPTSPILMAALLIWWRRLPSIFIQNLVIILGMAGVGSFLGVAFKPEIVVIMLVIFSIYDFIAVYKTKHMVEMAKAMIDSKAVLGLVIPPNIAGFKNTIGEVKPGGKFLVLGGGDIVFPLLLCSSLIVQGIFTSLVVAAFSVFGLGVSFFIFSKQKRRKPIPALPPIALFSIIGFFLTKLL